MQIKDVTLLKQNAAYLGRKSNRQKKCERKFTKTTERALGVKAIKDKCLRDFFTKRKQRHAPLFQFFNTIQN